MTELTIERVRELIQTYDDFTQAKSESGSWPNPEYADAESARIARYWLLNRYGRLPLARLALSLDAQLQQEREGREKLRAALGAIEREAIVQYMSAFNHGPAAETIVKLARAALAQIAATPDSGGQL